MPAIINSGSGGDLNPSLDGSGGPVATAIAIVRNTTLDTSLGTVLSAQVSYGWDQFASEARIVLPTQSGTIGDSVSVTMGAGLHVQRFSGTLVSFDTRLAPHAVTAVCKGPLYALEQYENGTQTIEQGDGAGRPGLAFEELVNAHSATLQQIITAVLQRVGVGYSSGNLDNPSHVYGLEAPEEFTWGTYETAAAYIQRVLQASAGYRLYEVNGTPFLRQISAIPNTSPDIAHFTLGVDIFSDSQATTTSIGRRTAVIVEGWDDGFGPARNVPDGVVIPSAFRISNSLIETDAFASELAAFWLTQVDRIQQTVRLTTPRDDLFEVGQTHFIDAAGGLSVSDYMWLRSFTAEIDSNGAFTQRSVYIAGATG